MLSHLLTACAYAIHLILSDPKTLDSLSLPEKQGMPLSKQSILNWLADDTATMGRLLLDRSEHTV